jgi:hypothetical protein
MNSRELGRRELGRPDRQTLRCGAGRLIEAGGPAILAAQTRRIV